MTTTKNKTLINSYIDLNSKREEKASQLALPLPIGLNAISWDWNTFPLHSKIPDEITSFLISAIFY